MTKRNPSHTRLGEGQPGRPKKGNTLTDILNAVFEEPRQFDGRRDPVDTKKLLAEYVRGALTKGEVTLVTNEVLKFSAESWMDLVKWAYNRIDGNPIQPVEGNQTTTLLFDAIPTVEKDYPRLENNEVVEVEGIDVTNELVKPI